MQTRKQAQPRAKTKQNKGESIKKRRKMVIDSSVEPEPKIKIDAIATRNHNFAKMIISGFNSQLQWILENDILLDDATNNDLIALQFIVANTLNNWHLRYLKGRQKENEHPESIKKDLYYQENLT